MDSRSHESGTYLFVTDLVNVFFSIDVAPESRPVLLYLGRVTVVICCAASGLSAYPGQGLVAADLGKWSHLPTVKLS
jgi:hypothetical protein